MNAPSEIDDNAIRFIAAKELEACTSAKQTILEEHSASFRWLMASMLAINAGGLLKVADFSGLSSTLQLVSSLAFLVGIISALAIAWLGQIASRAMLVPLADVTAFWTLVHVSGDFDEDEHNQYNQKVQAAANSGKNARWAGWLSTLSFAVGVVAIMSGQPDRQTAAKVVSSAQSTGQAKTK